MRSKLGVYALLALMPLLFASNLIIGRASTALVEPWTLAFWRWALASLMLLPFAGRGIAAEWVALRAARREILILGILGMLICGGLVYVSLHLTTATNGTLIYTASTLVIVVLDAVWFRHPLTPIRIAGVIVGFLGVAAIVLHGEPQRLISLEFNLGDLGLAVCAVSWAIYSVMLKGERLRRLSTWPLFAAISVVGAVTLGPAMVYEAVALDAFPRGLASWSSIVALAIMPSVLAFGFYQVGVREVGPSVTGVFLYLIPVYGVLLAVFLLGESFQTYHAVGLVLVVAGVVLATDPFRKNGLAG
ncbi:MAG TPA: DMT family transporter [Xanthobacteraceae bacterium]|jgi:drug/metabolite transporter (DMT)-like permease